MFDEDQNGEPVAGPSRPNTAPYPDTDYETDHDELRRRRSSIV